MTTPLLDSDSDDLLSFIIGAADESDADHPDQEEDGGNCDIVSIASSSATTPNERGAAPCSSGDEARLDLPTQLLQRSARGTKGRRSKPVTPLYFPPFDVLPEPYDSFVLDATAWVDELGVRMEDLEEQIRATKAKWATGKYTYMKHAHFKAKYAVVLPVSELGSIRKFDNRMVGKNWHLKGSLAPGVSIGVKCSVNRKSRSKDKLHPKRMNRTLPHHVDHKGRVVPECRCSFRALIYRHEKLPLVIVVFGEGHTNHESLRLMSNVDPSVETYIIEEGFRGRDLTSILKDLRAHFILEFQKRNIPIDLKDRRIFVGMAAARNIYRRHATEAKFLSDSDLDDVTLLASQHPAMLDVFQAAKTYRNSGKTHITQHLGLHVGGEAGIQAYKTHGVGGLVMLDATHKFNNKGYRTYTLMAVVFNDHKHPLGVRVCGHLVTSDLGHETLCTWLSQKFAIHGSPKEFLIDVDSVEFLAIERSFRENCPHVAYCYFHCLKAILDNMKGLTKNVREFIRARLRKLFLTTSKETFNAALAVVQELLKQFPPVYKYWKKQWEPKIQNWASCFRLFPCQDHQLPGELPSVDEVRKHGRCRVFCAPHWKCYKDSHRSRCPKAFRCSVCCTWKIMRQPQCNQRVPEVGS